MDANARESSPPYSPPWSATTAAAATPVPAPPPTAASPHQLLQLGVHHLLSLGQDGHQVAGFGCVAGSEQGVACSSVAFTSSSSNPVDVILAVVRVVVVYDELNIVDIKSSGGDISGNENAGLSLLKLAQHPLPLLLLLIPVDTHRRPTVLSHQPGQFIALSLSLGKDKDLSSLLASNFVQKPRKLIFFLILLTHVDDL